MSDNESQETELDPNASLDEVAPSIPGMEPGRKIGNFEVKRKLGAGGMGEVWLAYQASMERHIALKLLSPVFVQDDNFVNRFLKEAKLYGKLEHPNIVSAHDAGVDNGVHYMAMSFVDGEDLSAMCKRDRIIPEKDALSYVKKIAEALQYAWDQHKLLHRDIKPSNIMVDKNGVPKLMDMGISKSLSDDSSMTMTGSIVGTPYYISPEQARADKDIDFRADIYSLGATLYHVVTGELPFKAQTTMGVLSKLITETMTPPKVMNPKLSDGCAMLIEIMMAKDRDERQASWGEVVEDIDAVLNGGVPETPVPSGCAEHYQQAVAAAKRPGKSPASGGGGTSTIILTAVGVILVVAALAAVVVVVKLKKRAKAKQDPKPVTAGKTVEPSMTGTRPIQTVAVPKPVRKPTDATIDDSPKTTAKSVAATNATPLNQPAPPESVKTTTPWGGFYGGKKTAVTPTPPVEDPAVVKERQAKALWDFAMKYATDAKKRGDDFALAIDKFEKIKKNFAATKYEMLADDEIRGLRDAKSEAVDAVMTDLTAKADECVKRKEFEQAADVYNSYSDKFADETRKERTKQARACLDAPKQFETLVARLSTDLARSKGDWEGAVPYERKVALRELGHFFPAEAGDLTKAIEELKNTRKRLLDSFAKEKGTKVKLVIDGMMTECVVQGVEGDNIVVEDADGGKKIVTVTQLPPEEIEKRLEDFSALSKAVTAGMASLMNGNFDDARKRFSDAGVLSKTLVDAVDAEREATAARAFRAVLKKAGLSPEKVAYRDVLRQLSIKKLEKEEAERLIKDLDVHAADYADTRFVTDKKPVYDLLTSTAKKVFERQKSEILFGKDDKPVDNILDAVNKGVNLFAPDEKK